ncbi:BT4734/BF3469 family protein [Chryseobacterium sp. FH1]|uniref:BT4734/BF3469 family protein n=1 Tax=Chryseobacterium sp. FH1 TaxID=1233951 RepID=UPI0004E37C0A|nr:BT4734/BF3469 family protein [Chryseobacterium sp. FH1]KFC19294.1 hypothetical protein IO90_08265 [Chryseobacterium sp. FH1]
MEDLIFNQWGCNAFHGDFVTMPKFIEKIKNGFCDLIVKRIRDEFKLNGKSDLYKQNKSKLPGITISGRFSTARRKLENLEEYYGWKVLDIDNIDSEEKYQFIFNKVKEIPYTKVAFRSPTGNGLKIFVETNNRNSTKHSEYYKEVINYYESILNVEFDSSTCDVSRLCYYSYDPDIYYNEDSEIFEFSIEEKESKVLNDDDFFSLKMEEMVRFTKNKQQYKFGNRNNYLRLLSWNSSNHGIYESEFLEFCLQNYLEDDFDEFEITEIVKNTYKKYKSDFGKWENKLKKLLKEKSDSKIEIIESKPQIKNISFEDDIFQQYYDELSKTFPKKYTDFIQSLKSEREKDIVILTMMTVLNSIYRTE